MTDDTVPDFLPEDDDLDKPAPLTVTVVMRDAQACLEEMSDREESLDERIFRVFEVVNLLATSINTMMTSKQLSVPIPALGMRTTRELF